MWEVEGKDMSAFTHIRCVRGGWHVGSGREGYECIYSHKVCMLGVACGKLKGRI